MADQATASELAEVPASRLRQVVRVLLHAVHARESEHARRDDAKDRVGRWPRGGGIRSVDLVALGLERPVLLAERLGDASNRVAIAQSMGVALDDDVDGRKPSAAHADDAP